MATTKAQNLAGDALPLDGTTAITPSAAVTEHAPVLGFDKFSILPEERADYGIGDDRAVAWVRNPANWEKIEHSDRIREFGRERPGAKVAMTSDGDMVTNGDLVLMHYPQAHKDREEAARTAEYQEYVYGEAPDSYPRDKERLRHLSEQMHRQHERDGFIGAQSATQGLPYEQALSKYTSQQIDAEEARFRRGTRQSSFDSDDWARMVDSQRARGDRPARGRAVAVGNTGLGKTTAQKVAERQGR